MPSYLQPCISSLPLQFSRSPIPQSKICALNKNRSTFNTHRYAKETCLLLPCKMESLVSQFKNAYRQRDGYAISTVFTPVAPLEDPTRLRAFYRSTNAVALQSDLRSALLYHDGLDFSKQEATAWIEVFTEYWSATGELLLADETIAVHERARDVDWTKVYQAWKKLTDSIIRG